jgi:uncharacterized OB-fold protein
MEPVSFASRGVLLTCTTVWVERAGLEPPYTIGQVKLEDGPLVFGHVRGLHSHTAVPVDVRLVIAPEANEVPPFWFEPEDTR